MAWNMSKCITLFMIISYFYSSLANHHPIDLLNGDWIYPNANRACVKYNKFSKPWYSMHDIKNKRYYYFSGMKNWFDAVKICHKMNGYLAIPTSLKEAKILSENFKDYGMWIGVHQIFSKHHFISILGNPSGKAGFKEWKWKHSDKPDDTDPRNKCVEIVPNTPKGLIFDNSPCETRYPFFCEKIKCQYSPNHCDYSSMDYYNPMKSYPAECNGTVEQQRVPGDSVFLSNSYYKFIEQVQTNENAWNTCDKLGGYLAVPTSNKEANALIEYLKETKYHDEFKSIWVGVYNWGPQSEWFKVPGVPFDTAWVHFDKSEPDRNDGACAKHQCCLVMHTGNRFYPKKCDIERGFFCEFRSFKYSDDNSHLKSSNKTQKNRTGASLK